MGNLFGTAKEEIEEGAHKAASLGKSAVGFTVAKYLNQQVLKPDSHYEPGSYFLTTQKILQEQYINDFGSGPRPMRSIKSSSNYKCSYNKSNTCGESQRLL